MIAALGIVSKNYFLTGSSGAFSATSVSPTRTDITNFSQAITVSGQRPVLAMIIPDGSANQCYCGLNNGTYSVSAALGGELVLLRGATNVSQPIISYSQKTSSDIDIYERFSPARFLFWDWPTAGTYTYKMQASANNSGNSFDIYYCKMLLMEVLY